MQRWVKFAKNLRSFGWEPVVYTPENPFVNERDETLVQEIPLGMEIIRGPVFEVSKYFGAGGNSSGTGTKPSAFSGFKKELGNYIRSNFFIPDPRVLWVKPSVNLLSQYLSKNKIDVIVSSGSPHSLHLIGQQLSKKFSIPWLADFRDPWIEMLNFHGFKPSPAAFKKNEDLFKSVIQSADGLITAQGSVAEKFQGLTSKPVYLITNGYDEDDINSSPVIALDETKFNIVFIGIFYAIRNSTAFWQALDELAHENEGFKKRLKLIFAGKVHAEVMDDLKRNHLLAFCEFAGYVNHATAIGYEKGADALLLTTPSLPEFKYEIPGKLFEYLAVQKPIIAVAPQQNDSARIIHETKSGYIIDPTDKSGAKKIISKIFEDYRNGNLRVQTSAYEQYERKKLTSKLAALLDKVLPK